MKKTPLCVKIVKKALVGDKMNAKYIVYTSDTGHSLRYARMLSEKLDISAIPLDEAVRSVEHGTEIIYVGWLFANSIKGYKKANKLFNIGCTVAVGLCPTGELLKEVRRANSISDTSPLFTVQGGMDREKLHGINKFMINTLVKVLKKNKSPSVEDREKLRLIEEGGDFVSENNLARVIEFCEEK